jgi:hypothetical protein
MNDTSVSVKINVKSMVSFYYSTKTAQKERGDCKFSDFHEERQNAAVSNIDNAIGGFAVARLGRTARVHHIDAVLIMDIAAVGVAIEGNPASIRPGLRDQMIQPCIDIEGVPMAEKNFNISGKSHFGGGTKAGEVAVAAYSLEWEIGINGEKIIQFAFPIPEVEKQISLLAVLLDNLPEGVEITVSIRNNNDAHKASPLHKMKRAVISLSCIAEKGW